jgi:hypothetical protein
MLEANRDCLPPVAARCYEETLAIVKMGFETEALDLLRSEGSRLSAEALTRNGESTRHCRQFRD